MPQETKKIEWDMESPTVSEVKERLKNCGIGKDWCVEILRGNEYILPDDNLQLKDIQKLIIRVTPIIENVSAQQMIGSHAGNLSLSIMFARVFATWQLFLHYWRNIMKT